MIKYKIQVLLMVLFTGLVNGQSPVPFQIGEIHKIESKVLNEERVLNIYLPHGYDQKEKYPVIYLLDGSADEDVVHIAGLVQFMGLMYTMPPTIVVGIDNVDRKRDFTFKTDVPSLREKYPNTGHSAPFIKFIAEELQPYIRNHFSTNDTSSLIGQSLGGLLASEIVLKNPELFDRYYIVSPSLWWGEESLLKDADNLISQHNYSGKYIHISVGKNEDKIMVREAKALYKKLKPLSKKGVFVGLNVLKGHNHATVLHQAIYDALKLLYFPIA